MTFFGLSGFNLDFKIEFMECLLLIGYQNEYFESKGRMHDTVENKFMVESLKKRTIQLLEKLDHNILVICAPIGFDKNYTDMGNSYGIFQLIREKKAFIVGTYGYQTIDEIRNTKNKLVQLTNRRTLNAFQNTDLIQILEDARIDTIYIAGIFTSLCIDSTARTSYEYGYKTYILSDLIAGITDFENKYYLDNIFPSYAICKMSDEILAKQKS